MAAIALPNSLLNALRETFKDCDEFADNDQLRAVFVDEQLAPFRKGVPDSRDVDARVDMCLGYLLEKRAKGGRPILPIFLRSLQSRYEAGDDLFDRLDRLHARVAAEVPVETRPALPTSAARDDAAREFLSALAERINGLRFESAYSTLDKAELAEAAVDIVLFRMAEAAGDEIAIEAEDVFGRGRPARVRELVGYCDRRDLIPALVEACAAEFPAVAWPDPQAFATALAQSREEDAVARAIAGRIAECFNDDDCRVLCFLLDVDHQQFADADAFVRSHRLTAHFRDASQLHVLLENCRALRPLSEWPSLTGRETLMETRAGALRREFRRDLHAQLATRFSTEELRELCFTAGAEYALFAAQPASARAVFVVDIIQYFERQGMLDRLIAEGIRLNPAAEFPTGFSQIGKAKLAVDEAQRAMLVALHRLIVSQFSVAEITGVALRLGLADSAIQSFRGSRPKPGLALDLVVQADIEGKFAVLTEQCKQRRPTLDWENPAANP